MCSVCWKEGAAALRKNSRSYPLAVEGKEQVPEHTGERRPLCTTATAVEEQAPLSELFLNSFITQAGVQPFARWSRQL